MHQAYDRDREGLRRQLDLVLRALESLPMDPVGEVRVLVGEDSGCADDPWQSVEGGCPGGFGRAGRAAFARRGAIRTPARACAPRCGGPSCVWAVAAREGAVLSVLLREIVKASVCVPAAVGGEPCRREFHWHGGLSLGNGAGLAVYVVENSGVFSAILDQLKIVPTMVCTHGQLRLACLMLLDGLVKGGAVIYYSGDFDPEGLQMAQKLIQRYPGRVRQWRYSLDDCQTCMSGTMLPESPVLPESWLAKLAGVAARELESVGDEMLARRRAGYQEGLIEQLAEDVRRAMRARGR